MTIVGTEKFSSAIGLVLLMEAIAVLVGPPGAGQYAPKLQLAHKTLGAPNVLYQLYKFVMHG